MIEQWKPLFGNYEISSLGNLRNIRTNPNHLLKKEVDKNGYERISLWYEHKTRTFQVHRLVAQVFIPNPDNLPCINHKDNNRTNNCVDNLEWCTYSYNNNYCYNQNRNPHKKLSNENVEFIRNNKGTISYTELAKQFNVSIGLISDIINNKKRV